MDNQQETVLELGWLIGAIDGEGTVTLLRRKRSNNRFSFKAHISVTNCDPSFIERVARILTRLEVPHYVRWTKAKGRRRDHAIVSVDGIKRAMKLLPLITEFLCDEKREKARLLTEFCESRLADWHAAPFTPRQLEIYETIARLNQKGRTPIPRDYTRSSRSSKFPRFGERDEDIVQTTTA